jgi:UDP-N-acetylglucosamine:LPS N-acetylglucosamine transferase
LLENPTPENPEDLKLDLIYFNAGGGHRSAAMALQAVIASQRPTWQVRLVNLQEILDSLDVFRKISGIRLEDIYNLALAKGWTLGSELLLPIMHAVIRTYHPAQVKLLAPFWAERQPGMVVSVVPNFNRALFESLSRSLPRVPLVTILTDMADYPPHFWIEKQLQYLICGTDKAVEQARAAGHEAARVFRTSGMILRPEFYEPQTKSRPEELRKLGLDPDLPTGMLMFGGEGSSVMVPIAQQLGNSTTKLQLIMICGKNTKIRQRVTTLRTRNRIHLEGFTKEIPYFMNLCDFFIGKPGPGSISEAIKMKLPVFVERNAWTLPQERYNAEWITEQGVGVVLQNFRSIEDAVRAALTSGDLLRMKANAAALDNRAVFEIPEILARIAGL